MRWKELMKMEKMVGLKNLVEKKWQPRTNCLKSETVSLDSLTDRLDNSVDTINSIFLKDV